MNTLESWLRKNKRIAITFLALVLLPLIANGFIELPLPENYRGTLVTHGRIVSCDFQGLSKGSSKFFVGITLANPNAPYLRVNPEYRERSFYEGLCDRTAEVKVAYKAKKRFIGPIRFWVVAITEAGSV